MPPTNAVFGSMSPSLLKLTSDAIVIPEMIAPLSRSCATIVMSCGGASIAKLTSLPPVERMSFASYQFLTVITAQYIGIFSRSGFRPKSASSSAARSSASGCLRNSSQAAGASLGSGVPGGASNSPLHVTDRSPRMFSVSNALNCPAFGMPATMPYCCCTLGSDAVASILPSSSGGPAYWSRLGIRLEAATVFVGNSSGEPALVVPVAAGIGLPSAVTSAAQTPLYALARSIYARTTP